MRKGQNPAKFVKDVARPERVTVALLNYIPFLSGFYAETLDVLKVSLDSMRKDAGLSHEKLMRAIELIGEKVAPAVKKATGS